MTKREISAQLRQLADDLWSVEYRVNVDEVAKLLLDAIKVIDRIARFGEYRHDNLRLGAAAEIERLRQQLWLAREDMAHLVQQIDAVLGPR